METEIEGKRQSLYSPSPYRDSKRTKSEEREPMRQPDLGIAGTPTSTTSIGDVLKDLKDLSDDFSQQQAQTRWLLWQTADKQRQEAATKISIKNWWKYELRGHRDFETMECHRKLVTEHYATEAGISAAKQSTFTFSNFIGRNLSPFCVVDVGDARTKAQMLDHMKKTYGGKVNEWIHTTLQADIGGLSNDRTNKTGINGRLVFEPLISTFDKLQSVPLKLAMATISEIRSDLTWKKDWQQQTVFVPTDQGEVAQYVVWCAIDHLHGRCRIFFNEELLEARVFHDTFRRQEHAFMARKGWGKGKGKTVATIDSKTRDEVLDPDGSFMEMLGLQKGSGKGSRNPYSLAMEKATKSDLPFRIEMKAIESTDFVKMYNEHLYRLLNRWS